MDSPTFDLTQGYSSPWNSFIIDHLLDEFQRRGNEEHWPVMKSNDYMLEILRERYRRLHTTWRKAQPRITTKGTVETSAEIEERLVVERTRVLKEGRQTTRRRNKYQRRCAVLEHMVALKKDSTNGEGDLCAWQWLLQLIHTLGKHGMSSEDSDIDNNVMTIL
ncbi:hypothetical protein M404DRAFT_35728 [Pisolithus tinctorius Marx 270]|uniref:Uncharacterized protein n=1 Tax=Pisolithus tinctorius Marx 270 TaxID=870435 RepID=A0A0C3NDZ2_PISTI|nr:hypothetical protein M404DRAFT_35728 [Pisolithus tinctorius Marx 270]